MEMKRSILFSLLTLTGQIFSGAHAQSLPELLVPVDQETTARLESALGRELKGQTYVAKRYRIIQINFAALDQEKSAFTISAFADLKLQARAIETRGLSSAGELQQWTGELLGTPAQVSVHSGKEMPLPTVHLWVRTGAHEVPLRLIKEIATTAEARTSQRLPDLSGAPDDDTRAFTRLNLQTLSGEWFVPTLVNEIVIRPIDGDPRFHIIYEKDREKIPQSADDVPSEETKRKFQMREQFMRDLERENDQTH